MLFFGFATTHMKKEITKYLLLPHLLPTLCQEKREGRGSGRGSSRRLGRAALPAHSSGSA